MGDLALDTAVEGSDGHYRATLSRDWEIWGPNGGYLASLALRAAGEHTNLPRPAAFYCHFLKVADFSEVHLGVVTLRASKRAESMRVSITQNDSPILEALVWVVGEMEGLVHDFTVMPDVPGPRGLLSSEEIWGSENSYRFWNNLEARGPLVKAGPSAPGISVPFATKLDGWLCWYRFRPTAIFKDPFVDACRYLVLLDTLMWPAASVRHPWPTPFLAPSIDVAVRFHSFAPDDEWLLCDAESKVASEGLVSGTSAIWSENGSLLASGGQQMISRPNEAFPG